MHLNCKKISAFHSKIFFFSSPFFLIIQFLRPGMKHKAWFFFFCFKYVDTERNVQIHGGLGGKVYLPPAIPSNPTALKPQETKFPSTKTMFETIHLPKRSRETGQACKFSIPQTPVSFLFFPKQPKSVLMISTMLALSCRVLFSSMKKNEY